MAGTRVVVTFEVVWCGAMRTPLSGDYPRRPYLSDVVTPADWEQAQARPVPPRHPCACGCGRLIRRGRRWAHGHHTGRRTRLR